MFIRKGDTSFLTEHSLADLVDVWKLFSSLFICCYSSIDSGWGETGEKNAIFREIK